MYYRVLVASQRYHGDEALTYKSEEKLGYGQIISVPLQAKSVLGIVESKIPKPKFLTKDVLYAWGIFVPRKSLELLKWFKSYYPAPQGVLNELFTPPNLPKKLPEFQNKNPKLPVINLPPLTEQQADIIKSINSSEASSILLHGNTGTGKTRVYIELAKKSLSQGKSVIVLTPEIGLTGILLDTFTEVFGAKVLLTHSDMTPAQRRSVWLQASRSNSGLIVIGPRSAIFTPLKNIGLVVMDEAHDSSYKQEKSPHYQTSRVAAKLTDIHKASFVMGTATPLISDYYTFQNKELPIKRMTSLAINRPSLASVKIIDLRAKENFTKSPWIASSLINAIHNALKQKEQTLLFLNRRGSARLVLCSSCGWHAVCPNCDVSLTFHHDSYNLRCHSCDFTDKVPLSCPSCGNHELRFRSIGTKTLEQEALRLFPNATVSRFDADTAKLDRLNQQRLALQSGEVDILIGTQSIAKGFDLPKLSVVGIVQADSSLQIPDFTASELTYQLISQVSGRINRGHRDGSLFVQTYDPDSNLIAMSIKKDYLSFYNYELNQRKLYNFPPYTHLLKVSCSRSTSKSAFIACSNLADKLRSQIGQIIIEGPAPRFIEKVAGRYTWHLVIKSKSRNKLLEVVRKLPASCTYDLDPSDLL